MEKKIARVQFRENTTKSKLPLNIIIDYCARICMCVTKQKLLIDVFSKTKTKRESKQNHINQAKNKYASALDAACELVFRGLY